MKFEDLDVKLIAIVFIVSFFLLIAGQQVYKKYGIDKPLLEDIKQKNYIKNVEVEKFNDQVNIKIELNKVDSFKETYEDLNKTIQKYLKNKPYRITIINKKGELSNIYEEKIRFIIYEAQKTGEYVKMKDSIDELSIKENFYVKIEFDEDMNLYLTMEKNNEVFYQVLFEK
ncbi:hypothetical protein [Thermovenabulum sp.]|uniref:hypothetical protein n=1 Tax=Thermovenabulum sp. TaxID=3100335 RepID=UPI003C79DDC6